MLGLSPESLTPSLENLLKRIHPDDRARCRAVVDAALVQGELAPLEYRIIRPDGDVHWALQQGQTLCRAQAHTPSLTAIVFDITEMKQREESLLKANAELQQRLREQSELLTRAIKDCRLETARRMKAEELLQAIARMITGGERAAPRKPAHAPSTPAELTKREAEVLRLYALGNSRKEIAEQLHISVKTVETHKINSMKKLSLRSRAHVVQYAVNNGWL